MITDLLVILTGLLGFIILFIVCGSKTNRIVNINLALIIFGASLRLLLIGITRIYKISELENFCNQLNTIFILFVPVFYLYFKKLIQNKNSHAYKDLYHFIFPLLVILENKLSLIETIFDIKLNYKFVYIFILYSILYNIITFFQLKKHVWFKKASLEIAIKQNQLIRNWTIYFYCALNLMIIRVFISMFVEIKSNQIVNAQNGLWASSIVWLILFSKILRTPEILYGYSYLVKKSREFNSISNTLSHWNLVSKIEINNIQDQQLKEKIGAKIEKYIHDIDINLLQDNYFRNPDFALKEFAIVLNIPKSHLKYLFKYHSKVSFSDFKKISRIQDAIQLIDQKFLSTNTLESLSREVGFTSYNPFFTSFKDVVGKSPQDYITTIN